MHNLSAGGQMVKRIKLIAVSVVVAVFLALASSAAVSSCAVAVETSFPGAIEMMANPFGGGGVAG